MRHPLSHRLVFGAWSFRACVALVEDKARHDDRYQREILPSAVVHDQHRCQQEVVEEEEGEEYEEFLPYEPQVAPFEAAAVAGDDAEVHAEDGTHEEYGPHHQIQDIFLSRRLFHPKFPFHQVVPFHNDNV